MQAKIVGDWFYLDNYRFFLPTVDHYGIHFDKFFLRLGSGEDSHFQFPVTKEVGEGLLCMLDSHFDHEQTQ